MNLILIAVVSLGIIALVAAGILYAASKKFAVYEDPRIAQVAAVLPQANCGGCGYPGCSGLAGAIVKAGSLEGKFCPVGGQPVMEKVAAVMGLTAEAAEPMVAVVRCNGTCENRPRLTEYDGVRTCAIAAATYGGETGCSYGCLGCGDCTKACRFDAIHMNPETGLPEVDDDKCTACGACVKTCPKSIIELRYKGKKSRRVYVRCVNKDKGAVAKKACNVACIACGKCAKTCPFEAITVENNLAYIDYHKCKSCRKCVEVCPQNTIIDLNFPPRKPKEETPVEAVAAKPAAVKAAAAKPVEEVKVTAPTEDPRIAQIVDVLPQADCGGCGFAGCKKLATAIVEAGAIGDKLCPVGGDAVMEKVAAIMGATTKPVETAPVAEPVKTTEPVKAVEEVIPVVKAVGVLKPAAPLAKVEKAEPLNNMLVREAMAKSANIQNK